MAFGSTAVNNRDCRCILALHTTVYLGMFWGLNLIFAESLMRQKTMETICCTELMLPPMLSDDALAADNGVYWKKL